MIKREIFIFLLVGSLTVLIDFLTYRGLLFFSFFSLSTAKALGFITGTVFAYVANKLWTFAHQPHGRGSLLRFILLYFMTLSANVFINNKIFYLLNTFPYALQSAFLIATLTSATLNFIGMKWFVFRKSFARGLV